MKVNPKDPIVRYAILEAHGFRCYYSERYLNMFNSTIDHIIPQSYEGKEEELKEYKERLGQDFNKNDLSNLIPATWEINILKGNKLYNIPQAIFLLNQAKNKAPKILKRIEEFRKFKDFEKYLMLISTYISNSRNPKQELSKITKLLPNQFGPFDKTRIVSDEFFTRSESSVTLNAILPKLYEQCGSCCFEFRSIFLSDCMITLSHDQIINCLFLGLKTDYKLEKRGFIVNKHYTLPNMYYIQLGNNRFILEDREVGELCEIVDDFAEIYRDRFYKVEENWGTLNFTNLDPYDYSVKLVQIKRSLWRKMIEFSREFDYANGNSKWHIFNATSGTIMLYPNSDILAKLKPEKTESYHDEPYMNLDEILWIKWKRYDNQFGSNKEMPWSAEKTYFWLCKEFIPYMIYYFEYEKKKWVAKRPSFNEFIKNFEITDFVFNTDIRTKKRFEIIDNILELLNVMYSLQMFFNLDPKCSVSLKEVKDIYLGLKYILMNIDLPDYSHEYIKKQLNFYSAEKCKFNHCIDLINQKLESIEENEITSYHIESLFKCYIEALKGNNAFNIKKTVINEIKKLLNPIWEKYDSVKYFERIGKIKE